MNKYSDMSSEQIATSIARKWSGSAADASKVTKDYSAPLEFQQPEASFLDGLVLGIFCGSVVSFALLALIQAVS